MLGSLNIFCIFFLFFYFFSVFPNGRPPLWSSGQSFWLQIQRSRVRFPALPDFLSSNGSGTGPLSLVRSIEELLE